MHVSVCLTTGLLQAETLSAVRVAAVIGSSAAEDRCGRGDCFQLVQLSCPMRLFPIHLGDIRPSITHYLTVSLQRGHPEALLTFGTINN